MVVKTEVNEHDKMRGFLASYKAASSADGLKFSRYRWLPAETIVFTIHAEFYFRTIIIENKFMVLVTRGRQSFYDTCGGELQTREFFILPKF